MSLSLVPFRHFIIQARLADPIGIPTRLFRHPNNATMKVFFASVAALTVGVASSQKRMNEIKILEGHDRPEHVLSALPHEYISEAALPKSFTWGNVDGTNYLTHSLNQHL